MDGWMDGCINNYIKKYIYIYIYMLTPPMTDRRGEGEGWCPCPSMICQRIGDNHLSQTQFQKFRNFCNFQDGWQFLEISTRACNAPSPNLNLSLNLSLDSVLFLVLLLVPLLLFAESSFVVVLILG